MQTHISTPTQNPAAVLAKEYLEAQEGVSDHEVSTVVLSDDAVIWPSTEIINGVVTMRLKYISKGKNPRTHFDEEELASLTESVRAKGVIQAILLRPKKGGGYEIVAGERRFRAAMMAHGEDYPIPVLIREMTDEEASAAAAVENHERADMSPAEWARVAADKLGETKGDRDEAARILGWKRGLLDRRLALMNCSEQVLDALNQRKIQLGHAELLAALAKEQQDKLLPHIVGEGKSIAELKSVINNAACKLKAAIFDQGECGACPHNSALQKTMFAESITDGGCTNPACYREKTEAALEGIKDGLKDEWPVIRILRVGDNETRVKLTADGPGGVGAAQAEACRACSNYGAAVSGLPQALGTVFKNQCFDTACNAAKVAERVKADTEALKTAAAQPGPADAKSTVGAGKPEAPKATKVTERDAIKAYREKLWRTAMKQEIVKNPAKSRSYLIALALAGVARDIDSSAVNTVFEKVTGSKVSSSYDLTVALLSTDAMTSDATDTMITILAATAMLKLDVSKLQQLARHHQLDLRQYWKLDTEFLDILTKSEMEILAKEIRLDKAIGDGFAKLQSEKKPDLIKALLAVESFDYSAKIPAVLAY